MRLRKGISMVRSTLRVILFSVILGVGADARILRVPSDYPTIQVAVNTSLNGDTVVVAPGTYFENVIFRGKKILLTSRYYETGDVNFISSTIINGSRPKFADTASCVLFINHEDSTSVLRGFTLTGGEGTAWTDEHGAGVYREGGGVLSALASPTIEHNLITNNEGVNATGLSSGGGGGLRCGDGAPRILNNVVVSNRGMYGGGIVLNYCSGAIVKNNIVCLNRVDQFQANKTTYDGGGIWSNGKLSTSPAPNVIENNTIFRNFTNGAAGAFLAENSASATVRNNIMWDNRGVLQTGPITVSGTTVTFSYNDIMGTVSGTGNVDVDPGFADSSFILSAGSPCIDGGDPSTGFNDQENSSSPGNALWPSQGGLRNDIGAYGGKGASLFPAFDRPFLYTSVGSIDFGYVTPSTTPHSLTVYFWNYGTSPLRIDSVAVHGAVPAGFAVSSNAARLVAVNSDDSIVVTWTPGFSANVAFGDTVLVFHNDTNQVNPYSIIVTGSSFEVVPPTDGVMYAFSGTADGGNMYTVDTATGHLTKVGSTTFSDVLSARTNPLTKAIFAMVAAAHTELVMISADNARVAVLAPISLAGAKGMAFGSDGSLYACSFLGSLYKINLATGAATLAASTGVALSSLAFNPVDGILWGTVRSTAPTKDGVYTIDLATGTATLVGTTGFGVQTKDITFDKNGRLFGIVDSGSSSQSYLISINTTSGHGTVIGGMGVSGMEAIELESYHLSSVSINGAEDPRRFALEQNYPNPFNPSTYIRFDISSREKVSVIVYDLLGRELQRLVDEVKGPGMYEVQWNGSAFASGIYFCRMRAGTFAETRKMIYLK